MTPESMKTMQNDIDLEFDPRRVANFLKQIINTNCEEGFKWFADVRNEPLTAYDLLRAIDVLEHTEPEKVIITRGKDCYVPKG